MNSVLDPKERTQVSRAVLVSDSRDRGANGSAWIAADVRRRSRGLWGHVPSTDGKRRSSPAAIAGFTFNPLGAIASTLLAGEPASHEALSMLKSLMELESFARRVVGGDGEAVHGLVRGSLPTLRGRCMARPRREAERADAIRRSAAVKVSLRHSRSVKSSGDPAHDYGASAAERRTVRPGDVSVSRQFQNAELLGQETAIAFFDGVLGPLIEVGVPDRAVIGGDRGNATKRVVRAMPVQEGGGQALTLRIVAAAF